MPGFDRTGPMGAGPMTGGARGLCNPRSATQVGPGAGRGYGGGRGSRSYRNMVRATGLPGWRRSSRVGYQGEPFAESYTKEQELDFLKNQADILKAELDAVNVRLQELES